MALPLISPLLSPFSTQAKGDDDDLDALLTQYKVRASLRRLVRFLLPLHHMYNLSNLLATRVIVRHAPPPGRRIKNLPPSISLLSLPCDAYSCIHAFPRSQAEVGIKEDEPSPKGAAKDEEEESEDEEGGQGGKEGSAKKDDKKKKKKKKKPGDKKEEAPAEAKAGAGGKLSAQAKMIQARQKAIQVGREGRRAGGRDGVVSRLDVRAKASTESKMMDPDALACFFIAPFIHSLSLSLTFSRLPDVWQEEEERLRVAREEEEKRRAEEDAADEAERAAKEEEKR